MDDQLDALAGEPVPTLTLSPDLGDEPLVAVEEEEAAVPVASLDEELLSDDERRQVDAFAKQIDLADSALVLSYGAGAQKKMADFSQSALEKVRTQDLGEVGELITDVVGELRSLEVGEERGFLGIFKRGASRVEALTAKYDKAENNVNKIVGHLKDQQLTLMKDAKILDRLYDLNLTYFKELTMYILAGRKKLEEVRSGQLAELAAKARATGRTEDAEAVQKLTAACDRFEKKLSDLDLTRTIAMQTAPQIRFVQNNEMLMVEKIQTTLVNTIPLWKSQMVLALGMANNEAALKAQNAVTDMTNELLKKNAEKLKQSTTEVARASERGIVDIETLRATNDNLIQTFDEVMQIQAEGRQKRAEAEAEIRKMEAELKQKLMEVK